MFNLNCITMKRIKLFLTCILASVAIAATAQTRVAGVVVSSEDGEPVAGASVVVSGTTIGTLTGVDGKFVLASVPKDAETVIVSFIGMKTVVVPVSGNMKVVLEPDSIFLSDVIVVAYGTASRQSLTGAVAAVGTETIEKTISSSVTAALEGAAPGVQVNNTYGEPGSDPTIRIRGFGSVNGSNSPLYVVDGYPFQGNISDINSNDIESMTVLKDATSAALYGNRASNGVILITTKSAKAGKPTVTFTTNQGLYTRGIPEYERLDADAWMTQEWIGTRNYAMSTASLSLDADAAATWANTNLVSGVILNNIYNKDDDALFDANGKLLGTILPGYTDLDWEKELVKKGKRQQYGVSFSSNSDKYNVFSSLDYMNEEGYILNTNFERLSARVNSSFTPNKWFKGGINLSGTSQVQNYNSNANGSYYANPFYQLRYEAPIYPIYKHNADGSIMVDDAGEKVYDTDSDWRSNRHIIYERLRDYQRNRRLTLDMSAFGTLILPLGFEFTVKGNMNYRQRSNIKYDNPEIGDGATNNGRYSQYEYHYKTTNFQQQLYWSRQIAQSHIDVLAAHENYEYTYDYLYGMNSNMSIPGIFEMGNFTVNSSQPTGFSYIDRTESYLGRVRYNYAEKYFLDASFRRDGSSRFSQKSRWGNFWSLGASWDITAEDFMKSVPQFNFLKARASFGEAGNTGSIDYYAYQSLYELDKNGGNAALYKMQLAADELRWETSQTLDIALEGRVYDRANFSVGYFDKTSKDLLFDVPLPSSAGSYIWGDYPYMTQSQNIGSVSNRGWEISLDVDILRSNGFVWNVGTDATFMKNTILSLPDGEDIAAGTRRYSEGHSIYEFYTYHYEGVDQMTGRALYTMDPEKKEGATATQFVTINGTDYALDTAVALRDFRGSALPTVYGSVHTTLSYKGLSLYVLGTYSLGGLLLDSGYQDLMGHAANSPRAIHVDALKSWNGAPTGMTETSENRIDPNGIPVYDLNLSTYSNATSDRWLTDASYFVLKNVTLSYTFPRKNLLPLGIESLSVNAGIENAFTLTARQGINPQYSFSGGQDATYFTARIFNFGATLKF